MKFPACLAVIIFVSLFSACSNSGSSKNEVIFIDDGFKTAGKDEVVIDDASFKSGSSAYSQSRTGSRETTRIASDGSRLATAYDAYGNKTETRVFDDNPLLQMITLHTSASGEKQISVFAQNGDAKQLPANMLDKALTAPANELASAAGIFEGRRKNAQPMIVQTSQPQLQPMPSYKFPVQQTAPVPSEASDSEASEPEPSETEKPEGKAASAPKPKDENQASKTPSGEQK